MYEKTDKSTVVYYSKVQYTLQQTTIYTLEYQSKNLNILVTIMGVNPSGRGGHFPPPKPSDS